MIEALARRLAGNRTYSYVTFAFQVMLAIVFAVALAIATWDMFLTEVDYTWLWVAAGAGIASLVIGAVFGPHSGGARSSWWGSWVYSGIITMAFAAVVSMTITMTWGWANGGPWIRFAVLMFSFTGLFWLAYALLVMLAGPETSLTYDHAFLCGKRRTLGSMNKTPQHVICATEHHSGHHFNYARNFVHNFHFGISRQAADWSVRKALRASSSVPFFWPQVNQRIRTAFTEVQFELSEPAGRYIPNNLILSDGGVYDNLTNQWPASLAFAKLTLASHGEWDPASDVGVEVQKWPNLDLLVLGSAKAGVRWKALQGIGNSTAYPMWLMDIYRALVPWHWAQRLYRDYSIQYENGPEVRRREEQHLTWNGGANHTPAILAHVEMRPEDYGLEASLPDAIEQAPPQSAIVGAAVAALVTAGDYPDGWDDLRDYTSNLRSWPYPLGAHKTAALMYHAYALTYVGICVEIGVPAMAPRSYAQFLAWAT